MKRCNRCKVEKPLEDFAPSKREARSARCKACQKEMSSAHYLKYKDNYTKRDERKHKEYSAIIDSAKDVPCMDCGVKYPPYVMDFDHRDRSTKSFTISEMRRGACTKEKLYEEIAKCDVICANCHRERTHGKMAESGLLHFPAKEAGLIAP